MVKEKVYSADIEEVHNEFFTASDKTLADKAELSESLKSKAERLKKLGFNNCVDIDNDVRQDIKFKNLKKDQDIINHYKVLYPKHKFISHDNVISICQKYNLILGEINRFTGFVPDSNLKHIEEFLVHPSDYIAVTIDGRTEKSVKAAVDEYRFSSTGMMRLSGSSSLDNYYDSQSNKHKDNIDILAQFQAFKSGLSYSRLRLIPPSFMICAPQKDMIINSNERVINHQIENVPVEQKFPLDPVVLCKVKEGYIIVTAWGDEASDELVVNHQMN